MKKLIVACVMATSAASAFAEWTHLGDASVGGFYVDFGTIRKDGDLRKVWSVLNFKQRDISGAMSAQFRTEFDCKDERKRMIAFSRHSEAMAFGVTLDSNPSPEPWSAIPPESLSEETLKIVCAK